MILLNLGKKSSYKILQVLTRPLARSCLNIHLSSSYKIFPLAKSYQELLQDSVYGWLLFWCKIYVIDRRYHNKCILAPPIIKSFNQTGISIIQRLLCDLNLCFHPNFYFFKFTLFYVNLRKKR